jgi:hypothetical protein
VCSLSKCIFFMWLSVLGRCWTSERYHRHGFRNSVDHALCAQYPELIDHLLIGCSVVREVWFIILSRCNLHNQVPMLNSSLCNWWLRARKQIAKARRKAFDSLVVRVAWCLWIEQNCRVFSATVKSVARVACVAWDMLQVWCQAGIVFVSMLLGE